MLAISQTELNKLLSTGREKQTAGQPETRAPRFRTFSRPQGFPQDDSCAITQEELNRVLAKHE